MNDVMADEFYGNSKGTSNQDTNSCRTEGTDSDLTDAELRAAGRHRSKQQLPTYAKRTRKQLIATAKKRREERTRTVRLSDGPLVSVPPTVPNERPV